MKRLNVVSFSDGSLGPILFALDRAGAMARHRLADTVGLSRATVTKSVQKLLERGIVEEIDRGESSPGGGPRPVLLAIRADAFDVVGLDIRREKITGCLVGANGKVVTTTHSVLSPGISADALLTTLIDVVTRLRLGRLAPLGAIGIGSVGPVDITGGRSHPLGFPALHGLNIVRLLESHFGVPVSIRTGAVAAAYGEERLSAGEDVEIKSIAFVVIDFLGIGIGLITGGTGWLTDHGGVSELGHVTVDIDGRPCECGRRGCLSQYASGAVAIRRRHPASDMSDAEAMMASIARDAEDGDVRAREALAEAGRYLGCAIVDVDRLLRPSRIVLGSSHEHLAAWYMRGIEAYLDESGEQPDAPTLRERLGLARMGGTAIAFGAATLQIEQFLRSPSRILDIVAGHAAGRDTAETGISST